MSKNKLILVDFDGTLFETDDMNYYSYLAACKVFGFNFSKKDFLREFRGRYYKDFLPRLCSNISAAQMENIHDKKNEIVSNFISKIKINNTLITLLKTMHRSSFICLVTTASKKTVLLTLSFFKLTNVFDNLICGEDVKKHKPNPECYLNALKKYYFIKKKDVMVFEDSIDGIKAALACNLQVFVTLSFSKKGFLKKYND